MTSRRNHLALGAFGVALGFVISMAGLSDWGELHRFFTLGRYDGGATAANLRLLIGFGLAVALSAVAFRLFARHDQIPSKPIRTGTVPGAILFGIGWALAGACPGAALVQLGEGKGAAAATVAGILGGAWLHDRLRKRLGWARHSCVD